MNTGRKEGKIRSCMIIIMITHLLAIFLVSAKVGLSLFLLRVKKLNKYKTKNTTMRQCHTQKEKKEKPISNTSHTLTHTHRHTDTHFFTLLRFEPNKHHHGCHQSDNHSQQFNLLSSYQQTLSRWPCPSPQQPQAFF